MSSTYTALIQHDGDWWIGWIKEIAGVNSQGKSREELIENLQSALGEALHMNCEDAEASAMDGYEEVSLTV